MLALIALLAAQPVTPPGEEPVPPHAVSNANAGATPIKGREVFEAFGGEPGIDRIVDAFVTRNFADPVIGDIFRNHDQVRIRRTLKEQFCYLLGGGCAYTGRDMKLAHRDMGVQTADFNRLVENLQWAMDREGVPFAMQNRLLAKLAPMKREVVER